MQESPHTQKKIRRKIEEQIQKNRVRTGRKAMRMKKDW